MAPASPSKPRRRAATVAFWTMTVMASLVGGYALVYLLTGANHAPELVRASRIVVPAVFLTHVGMGGLALLIGPWQFVDRLRARWPKVHRRVGWVYTVACLASAAGGFFLAFRTSTGWGSGAAFALLAAVWVYATGMTVVTAVRREFGEHRRWAIRGYALTLSGLTLRLYLTVVLVADLPIMPAYIWIAWGCWVPNLLVALYVTRRPRRTEALRVQPAA